MVCENEQSRRVSHRKLLWLSSPRMSTILMRIFIHSTTSTIKIHTYTFCFHFNSLLKTCTKNSILGEWYWYAIRFLIELKLYQEKLNLFILRKISSKVTLYFIFLHITPSKNQWLFQYSCEFAWVIFSDILCNKMCLDM